MPDERVVVLLRIYFEECDRRAVVRGRKGGMQVVFPGGEFAIYRAESVSWDQRTGTLNWEHSGRSSVFEHCGASLQVVAWRRVDGSVRDRTWRLKTGYVGRL